MDGIEVKWLLSGVISADSWAAYQSVGVVAKGPALAQVGAACQRWPPRLLAAGGGRSGHPSAAAAGPRCSARSGGCR